MDAEARIKRKMTKKAIPDGTPYIIVSPFQIVGMSEAPRPKGGLPDKALPFCAPSCPTLNGGIYETLDGQPFQTKPASPIMSSFES
jgi:hypothetical protein